MDKLGMVKKAMVAAALVSSVVLTTPVDPIPATTATTQTQPTESVQKLYRPVLDERIPDAPKQRGDKAWKWWTEQLKRIKRGWVEPTTGKYICGYHYWYLNFVKIPRQDKDTLEISGWDAPFYRDNDDEILSLMWNNRERELSDGRQISAKNSVFAKPRTIGYSQMEFLGVDSYIFLFGAGRTRFICRAYPTEKPMKAEVSWFRTLYSEHIPAFLKTWNGRELEILQDNSENFAVGFKSGKTEVTHNWIQYRLVPDESHAGIGKAQRFSKLTAVEAGLWTGNSLDNFYIENKDCVGAADHQWGVIVIGGTSNAIINKSSNYKTIYFNPSEYNARTHFTPKTKALLGYIDLHTGRSLVDEAMVWILAERAKAEGNSELAAKGKVENPLTPQEAFEPSTSFAYDQAKLQAQIGYVQSHNLDKMWVSGRLEYVRGSNNKRVEFWPDPEGTPEDKRGPWTINRAGLPNDSIPNLHIAGIDDTFKGLKPGQKLAARDSRNCMIIWRQPTLLLGDNTDMACAMYYERNPDMEATYHEFLKGMLLYNIQQAIYEFNHWAFIFWLRDKNEGHRLYWVNEHTPGIEIKGNKKSELTALGYRFLAEGRHQNITLLPLLYSLMLWGSGQNDDIGSAFHVLLFLLNATKDWTADDARDEWEAVQQRQEDFIRLGQNSQTGTYERQQPKRDDFIRLGSQSTYNQYAA